jgi:hypothetical protein
MNRQFKVPSTPALSRAGLREMEERDVPAVAELYRRYMERFDMIPLLEEEGVLHQFLSGRGKGEREASTGRRRRQVVWTYVVEVSSSTTVLICCCIRKSDKSLPWVGSLCKGSQWPAAFA